jgi:hypothetical protein
MFCVFLLLHALVTNIEYSNIRRSKIVLWRLRGFVFLPPPKTRRPRFAAPKPRNNVFMATLKDRVRKGIATLKASPRSASRRHVGSTTQLVTPIKLRLPDQAKPNIKEQGELPEWSTKIGATTGQGLSAGFRAECEVAAPPETCAKVGLPEGSTWGACLVRSLLHAAITHGDMSAAREIADRLEGKAPNANAAGGQQRFQIKVMYVDELMDAQLRAIAPFIMGRVACPGMWEFLEHYLRIKFPSTYKEVKSQFDELTPEERDDFSRALQEEVCQGLSQTSGTSGKPN